MGAVVASTRTNVGALFVYTATDMDIGPQGVLSYSLQYPDPHFSVDRMFGSLISLQNLYLGNIGASTFYNPRIVICDPHVCTGIYVYMTVIAQDVHYPMFSQKVYYATCSDGTPPDQVIPSICTDLDLVVGALQGVVFLNTTPGVFVLNSSTGALTTNITMDYRRARGYTVQLLCGGLTSTSTVYVTITPPPNYNPLEFSSNEYVFNISRTTPPYYPVGQIMATDEDTWATPTYSLQNNLYFNIDGFSGTIQAINWVYNHTCDVLVLNAAVTDGVYADFALVYIVLNIVYTPATTTNQATRPVNSTPSVTTLPAVTKLVIDPPNIPSSCIVPTTSYSTPNTTPNTTVFVPTEQAPVRIVLPIVLILVFSIIFISVIPLCVCLWRRKFYAHVSSQAAGGR